MHLLIEPDFMISILRVKFCCIVHDNEDIQNLDSDLKTVKDRIKSNRKAQIYSRIFFRQTHRNHYVNLTVFLS